jgi:putative ABC transport system ATP-binding protein
MSTAPSSSNGAVFAARGITKVYDMGEVKVNALRGIDLDLYEGEMVVLLGPSGSGKSTLLNILGGLDVPTSGHVVYRGRDLTEADDADLTLYRRENVGFVFQFYNLIPSLTARENVALVTEIVEHPMTPEEALRIVGLGSRLDHFPAQLSGGEQQRVAYCRAVLNKPPLVLADEPTGSVDDEHARVILDELRGLVRERGTSVVLVTHRADAAAQASRLLRLAGGRLETP